MPIFSQPESVPLVTRRVGGVLWTAMLHCCCCIATSFGELGPIVREVYNFLELYIYIILYICMNMHMHCAYEYAYVSMMKGYTNMAWFLDLEKAIMDPMVLELDP